MKSISASILLIVGLSAQLTFAQEKVPVQELVETTICNILKNPSLYNNKIVKVSAYVDASSEYSVLVDNRCDKSLWLVFADGSVPPKLEAFVNENRTPGGKNVKGQQSSAIPVRLCRDSNFEELERYLNLNAKAADCANRPPPDLEHLSECTTYRISATFTGRLDGVSKSVSKSRRDDAGSNRSDRKGFGHMGLFDAQLVVQSVTDVVAIDPYQVVRSK